MFDFLIKGFSINRAQRFIDSLEPKVNIHVPEHLPLPSIWTLKRAAKTVSIINGMENKLMTLSDEQLREKTRHFRERYQSGVKERQIEKDRLEGEFKSAQSNDARDGLTDQLKKIEEEIKKIRQQVLSDMLPEAFAVVRETSRRVLGLRHYDIQLVGGMVLHEGCIAEMATGEGKTLVATLPMYLNALTGEGVHVVTVNDYLAKRDREWMGPIFEFLGLTVGVILHDMMPDERHIAYGADITYGTNNEFGFDYLRDNMVISKNEMVQRNYHYAIVDEVDSILIDEARTPLIISGPAEQSTGTYYQAFDIAKRLNGIRLTESDEIDAKYKGKDAEALSAGYDYVSDEKAKSISLTDQGEEKAARAFGIDNLHDITTTEYRHHILQALKAKEFFKRDVDYVVRDGEVIIVDEFTGRLMPGRRWSDGLHQAVEAREGIRIERENQTLATITFQNYFRMYEKLSGMTGTAYTEASEFKEIYKLDTVVLPTNKPLSRKNYDDCIFKTIKEKYNAAVEEIVNAYHKGQPVLVGTVSIEKSEILSAMLKQRGIPHQVLNAKYHEREAQIVAQAGRYQAVTIATNMAGRGTDIVLGGNAEFLARALADAQRSEDEADELHEQRVKIFLEQERRRVKEEQAKVIAAGGLYVIGTERHEARRIDNQLRGRSGRQGDPGASRFFISLEDDLMRLFGGDRLMMIMDRMSFEDGQVLENPLLSRSIGIAQKRVENFNFEIRKQLIEYDNVMNKQREAVYGLRRSILESDNVKDRVIEAVGDAADRALDRYLYGGSRDVEWDFDGLLVFLATTFGVDLRGQRSGIREMDYEQVKETVLNKVFERYGEKEQVFGQDVMRHLEKMLLLNIIDSKWKDHLYAMDQLKGGVGLRSYGQRDPLIEYKREGFEMFQMMFDGITDEVAQLVFKAQPVSRERKVQGVFDSVPQNLVHNEFSGIPGARQQEAPVPIAAPRGFEPMDTGASPVTQSFQRHEEKVGRNDPCPCGSGKKYKKCCGR
ncbi:MAG: preprotein translocase subunit SecA [Candidatus Omnitrophota bacterium]